MNGTQQTKWMWQKHQQHQQYAASREKDRESENERASEKMWTKNRSFNFALDYSQERDLIYLIFGCPILFWHYIYFLFFSFGFVSFFSSLFLHCAHIL